MALRCLFLFLFLAFTSEGGNPSDFLDRMRQFITGTSSARLDFSKNSDYCNLTGISCDDQRDVIGVDISGLALQGEFPGDICSHFPQLRFLRVGGNSFHGGFPLGIINCSFLEELNMSSAGLTGRPPDFSPLQSLRVLDLSYNFFSGDFPMSITNLTKLEVLNMNENEGFNLWKLPENISRLLELKTMIVTSCMLYGGIPQSIGNMTSLVDLELSGNYLTGRIPVEVGRLKNLEMLELYYNQLEGEIPRELGNLTLLANLDMSGNTFSGQIPASVCRLPKLSVLQLYNNSLSGNIPAEIANLTALNTLSLYGNFLTGEVPQNLGKTSTLVALDLSENNFTGNLPQGLCSNGKLNYLLALKNSFSGQIPESYGRCKSLVRFRVSNNNLQGKIPEEIFSLPHAFIIDVAYNNLGGFIPENIQNARNLSELFLQGNKISGSIPPQISSAVNLMKVDLSYNLLSGPIPSEIGNLRLLNLLLLRENQLNSSIPESLSSLSSLNVLDISYNQLEGKIPEKLSVLLPNSMNFSHNHLSGPIPYPFLEGALLDSFSGNPGLCVSGTVNSLGFPVCPKSSDRRRINLIWLIVTSMGIIVLGSLLFLNRLLSRQAEAMEKEEIFSSYEIKTFHQLSFSDREIFEALVDENIIGYGGSGTVYKIKLRNGKVIAVKKLWTRKVKDSASSDHLVQVKELKSEVETLGNIRHKNIVKLYSYLSSRDCNLLMYEYMPNGNLWDALHNGKIVLDWKTRHQIALGIAQGLSYLHHDIMPPIIHRDIKSTNILLDRNYQPKVADFGIAKVLQAGGSQDPTTTTVIAGTYGYLAPEYAYTSKASTKCDVYSFGVILMELVTGKKNVEPEFGENKDIVTWVSGKVETMEGAMNLLDNRVSSSFSDEMIKVLRIAILCTCKAAAHRPMMNDVVQLLMEASPSTAECCKIPYKTEKENENANGPKFIM